MRIICCVAAILVINLVCSSKPTGTIEEKAIQLKIHWQFLLSEDGKLMDLIDSVIVIKRDNYLICLARIVKEDIKITVNKYGDQLSDSVLSTRVGLSVHIFKDGDTVGVKYDSLGALTGKRFNVDSFLTGNMCKGMEIYNNSDSLLLVESASNKNNIALAEKYVLKNKQVENAFDSLYCYYTGQKIETDISFSKKLEQAKQMRLYKVVIIYNDIPAGKYPFAVPKRKMEWELKNVPVPYVQQIDELFKRHKQAHL